MIGQVPFGRGIYTFIFSLVWATLCSDLFVWSMLRPSAMLHSFSSFLIFMKKLTALICQADSISANQDYIGYSQSWGGGLRDVTQPLGSFLPCLTEMFVRAEVRSASGALVPMQNWGPIGVDSCQRCYHIVNFYHSWGAARSRWAVQLFCAAWLQTLLWRCHQMSLTLTALRHGSWGGTFFHFFSTDPHPLLCFSVFMNINLLLHIFCSGHHKCLRF